MQVHQLASTADKNEASSNVSSDTPLRPRKRPRRPKTWKRVVAKAKRARGEEYVSPSTGKVVAARKTGPSCCCKRKGCFDLFMCEGVVNLSFLPGVLHPGRCQWIETKFNVTDNVTNVNETMPLHKPAVVTTQKRKGSSRG